MQMKRCNIVTKFPCRVATSFCISRRRMVVPIYKRLEADRARIQIVQHDNIILLLAFFEDFGPADCMNFQLKSMDVFENVEKGGKHSVKLVDAKFALPHKEDKQPRTEQHKFTCLDYPEYPGEHDDITIGFGSQPGTLFQFSRVLVNGVTICRARLTVMYKKSEIDSRRLYLLHRRYRALLPSGGKYNLDY